MFEIKIGSRVMLTDEEDYSLGIVRNITENMALVQTGESEYIETLKETLIPIVDVEYIGG